MKRHHTRSIAEGTVVRSAVHGNSSLGYLRAPYGCTLRYLIALHYRRDRDATETIDGYPDISPVGKKERFAHTARFLFCGSSISHRPVSKWWDYIGGGGWLPWSHANRFFYTYLLPGMEPVVIVS